MNTSHRIVNVAFSSYEMGDIARYESDGASAIAMTVVTCDVRAGREPDAIEALGRVFTRLCAEHLMIDPLRIAVYVTQHPAYEIYRDGGRAPNWSAEERSS